jgi:hypothetical protein
VDEGQFLEGLLYRLNLIHLEATPGTASAGIPVATDSAIRETLPLARPGGAIRHSIAQYA